MLSIVACITKTLRDSIRLFRGMRVYCILLDLVMDLLFLILSSKVCHDRNARAMLKTILN